MLHTPTNTPYALKCMRKGQIIALKQVRLGLGLVLGLGLGLGLGSGLGLGLG